MKKSIPIQHRLPKDRVEAKLNEVGMGACVWCSLVKDSWESNPECAESDPSYRRVRGYKVREKKDPWEGSGSRVLEPWMVGPDEGRYGHAFRGINVVDLIEMIKLLDEEQIHLFGNLLLKAQIPGLVNMLR